MLVRSLFLKSCCSALSCLCACVPTRTRAPPCKVRGVAQPVPPRHHRDSLLELLERRRGRRRGRFGGRRVLNSARRAATRLDRGGRLLPQRPARQDQGEGRGTRPCTVFLGVCFEGFPEHAANPAIEPSAVFCFVCGFNSLRAASRASACLLPLPSWSPPRMYQGCANHQDFAGLGVALPDHLQVWLLHPHVFHICVPSFFALGFCFHSSSLSCLTSTPPPSPLLVCLHPL